MVGCPVKRVLAMAMCLGATAPALADIYAFEDSGGVVHLSNIPSDDRYSVAVRAAAPSSQQNDAGAATVPKRGARTHYVPLVNSVAREHNIDPALLHAVIAVESAYNPRAVSSRGAVGLMQLMPEIAARYGADDRYDPAENVRAGTQYLRDLLEKYDDDLTLALAAYNAGETAVTRSGNQIPRNNETPTYVQKVLSLYRRYQPQYH